MKGISNRYKPLVKAQRNRQAAEREKEKLEAKVRAKHLRRLNRRKDSSPPKA